MRATKVLPLLLLLLVGCGAPPDEPPPNFLLISLDTLRADHVGAYGYPRDTTPNIDGLAARGTVFLNSFAQAPNTAPSHASIFTSLYPTVHGIRSHGLNLDPSVETLAELLQNNGFATAAFSQLNGDTYRPGFDTYERLPSPFKRGNGLGDISMVLDWLDHQAEKPFFLFLHSYDVHLPYNPLEEYLRLFEPDYQGGLPTTIDRKIIDRINSSELEVTDEDNRFIVSLYDAELRRADEILGTLFEHLRSSGQFERTVIIFLADHGEEFGEHGQMGRHSHTLYNELLHTPLIVAGPGVPEGLRIDTRVSNMDVAPTVLTAAGLDAPEAFLGRPLQPVWSGEETKDREVVAERNNSMALFSGPYKYYKRERWGGTTGELYDLSTDPTEQRDISLENPEVFRRLRSRLEEVERDLRLRALDHEQPESEHLTEDEKERLRALGYLQT
ncbi:MAG: sulfatase [Thermoanaerobaculia bacterium]